MLSLSSKIYHETLILFILWILETVPLVMLKDMNKAVKVIYMTIYVFTYFVLWIGVIISFIFLESL